MAEVRLNITVTNQGGAVIASLQKNLAGLGTTSDTVKAKMGGLDAVLAGFGAGAGAAVFDAIASAALSLASALPSAVANLVQTSGAITDLAARTGFSTEELQKFAFAGAMVGVSTEEISAGMTRLQKAMVEGGEGASAALARIGLSFEQLRSMAPDDQLATVVEAISRIPDPAERSAVAMELMGRGGAALIPLGANLREVMENAERLGVVMSGEVTAAADDLGDSVGALGAVWTGLQNNLVSVIVTSEPVHALINGLVEIVGQFSIAVRENSDSLRAMVDGGVVFVAEALVQLVSAVSIAVDAWSGMTIALIGVQAYYEAVGQAAIALWDVMSNPGSALTTIENLQRSLQDLATRTQQSIADEMSRNAQRQETVSKVAGAFEQLRDKVAAAAGATHQSAQSAEAAGGSFGKLGTAAKDAAEGFKVYKEVTASVGAELRQLAASAEGSLAGKLQSIAEKTRASMEKLQQALAKTGDKTGFDQAAAEVQKLDAALRQAALNDARVGALGKSMRDLAVEARETTSVFEEFIAQGGSLSDYGDEGLRSMLDDLEELASGLDRSSDEYRELATVIDQVKGHMADQGVLTTKELDQWEKTYEASEKYWEKQKKAEEEAREEWERQNLSVQDFRTSLEQVAGVLDQIGATSLGGLVGGLVAGAEAGHQMANALRNIQANGLSLQNVGTLLAGAASAVGSFLQATDKRSGTDRALGGAGVGAGVGQQIGSVFGPTGAVVGAVAGGFIGAIAGAFRKPGWVKTAEAASKQFGFKVSDDLAKAMEETRKTLGVSREDAALLHLSDAMAESGKDARTFSGSVTDLMNSVKSGSVPAREGIEEIGEAFTQIAEEADRAGSVGDRALLDVIRRSRELGLEVPEISEYVKGQLATAVTGIAALVGQMSEVDGIRVAGGIQIVDEQGARDQAVLFSSVFWASVKEMGVVQAADAMREPFAALKTKIGESFGPELADQLLGPMQRIFSMTEEGNPFRGAVDGAEGLRQALEGLANTGYLTRDSFQAVENQAMAAFQQMTAAGAAPDEALQAMAPLLQSLVSASQNYGIALDANTQSLVNQAQQAGVAFQTDPQQRMVEVLEAIAVKLGAELPAAAGTAASSFDAMAGTSEASLAQMSGTASSSFSAIGATGAAEMAALAGATSSSFDAIASAASATVTEAWGSMASQVVSQATSAGAGVGTAFDQMASQVQAAVVGIGSTLDGLERTIHIPVQFDVENLPDLPGGGSGSGGGDVPGFASGGIVDPRPGGTLARVGEGGQAELVAPVRAFSAHLADRLAERVGGSGGGTVNITVNVQGAGEPQQVAQRVIEELRRNVGGSASVLRDITRGRA